MSPPTYFCACTADAIMSIAAKISFLVFIRNVIIIMFAIDKCIQSLNALIIIFRAETLFPPAKGLTKHRLAFASHHED